MPVIGTEEFQNFFNSKFPKMIALAHKYDAILRISRLSGLKPVGNEVNLARVKKLEPAAREEAILHTREARKKLKNFLPYLQWCPTR